MQFDFVRTKTHFINNFLLAACALFAAVIARAEPPDAARVAEIAAMLPERAQGFGQPITNRAVWDQAVARHPDLQKWVPRAVELAAKPMPEQPEALYLEYSKTGNRTHWQTVAAARRDRVEAFTLAECEENKGRFLAPLEKTIAALCAEPTWVMPAHDGRLKNLHGEVIDVDLGSSMLGAELATADYLLGDHLSPATRNLIHENLRRRLFTPYRDAMDGTRPPFGWMHASNNWYAVCIDSVTAAALATEDSREERAWCIATAEKRIDSYLTGGFAPDGYCVEGVGYWNYGFGHFTRLAENIRQATGGKVELLALPKAGQPALFGLRSEILDNVYTSIADCHPGDEPSAIIVKYLCERFGVDNSRWRNAPPGGSLYETVAMAFVPEELPKIKTDVDLNEFSRRTWFPDGGVLICRPGPGATVPFAAAIKGGNNGVSHGHHDVGSFSVVSGKTMVICDPGGEVYTSRTFGPHRYDSKVLNSFGHAVPVIDGQLQRNGPAARAVVVEKNFADTTDTLKFDLSSAYDSTNLQKLERVFIYQRGDAPSLEVRDQASFATPANFESTFITWGKIHRVKKNEIEITDGKDRVRVVIDTQNRPFHVTQTLIDEDVSGKRKPYHIGIALDAKVSDATVTLRISPAKK